MEERASLRQIAAFASHGVARLPWLLFRRPCDGSLFPVRTAAFLLVGISGSLPPSAHAPGSPASSRAAAASRSLFPRFPSARARRRRGPPLPLRGRAPSREEARVERVVIDAHVTYDDGEPIRDLVAADFVVRGRRQTRAARIGRVGSRERSRSPRRCKPGEITWGETPALPEPVLAYPPGRVIVLFYQTNYEPAAHARASCGWRSTPTISSRRFSRPTGSRSSRSTRT